MKFYAAVHTDVGITKKTNQDSALLLTAQTDDGDVLLAAVCDGMGGLAKGETASAAMALALQDWFEREFPALLYAGLDPAQLSASWQKVIDGANTRIADFGAAAHVQMGTTVAALLVARGQYFLMNVGDSRVYLLSDAIYQLTKDQTYIQREMDLGHMTWQQAMAHPQRNVLLQCVGASAAVAPDYGTGAVRPGQRFLLCSDGFRHVLDPQELYQSLGPAADGTEEGMRRALQDLTELDKRRQESDNITAMLIRVE